MGLNIDDLRKPRAGAMYRSPGRLYLTADGELVGQGDPRGVKLLVGKGGEIPTAEAARYGLIISDTLMPQPEAEEASAGEASAADGPAGEPEVTADPEPEPKAAPRPKGRSA